ncbi:MAG: hypothetical protein MMC23_004039 [Stictis urceolatum]|nr:hypothetical protein [Stictis urceolata]
MSTAIFPPLPPHELAKEIQATADRELQWLLASLQDTFASLKSGLSECDALLAPTEPGATLVVSSLRSESVKGLVTRVGTRLVKGDISLRLPSLPPPPKSASYPLHLSSPLILAQLSTARNLINQALDVVDTSTWTGDPTNASFISGQLRLLAELLLDAKSSLRGSDDQVSRWPEDALEEGLFDPALPGTLAVNVLIREGGIVVFFRTLQVVEGGVSEGGSGGLSLRQRLGLAAKLPEHDEMERVFGFRGAEVKVREKVRVESQDPSLMAVMAKLSALEHGVGVARRSLGAVMGEGEEDEV